MTRNRISPDFYAPIIRLVVALFLLLIIRAVLLALPMLKDWFIPELRLHGTDIAPMLVSFLIIVVLINFAREFSYQLRINFPRFSEGPAILGSTVYVVAVILAYDALSIVHIQDPDLRRLYQLTFVVLVLLGLLRGGIGLYRSVGTISTLFQREVMRATGELYTCPNCGELNLAVSKFCSNCGWDLEKARAQSTSVKCSNCGFENQPTAGFCVNCGADLKAAEVVASQAVPALVKCPNCGVENQATARFCVNCGTQLGTGEAVQA